LIRDLPNIRLRLHTTNGLINHFLGLPGTGKTSIARELVKRIRDRIKRLKSCVREGPIQATSLADSVIY